MVLFRYHGLELIDIPESERPYYCRFAVHARETGHRLVEFWTNRNLKGRYSLNDRGEFECIDADYSLAGLGEKAVYYRLRNEAAKTSK